MPNAVQSGYRLCFSEMTGPKSILSFGHGRPTWPHENSNHEKRPKWIEPMTSSANMSVVQLVVCGTLLVTFIIIISRCPPRESQNKKARIGRMLLLAVGVLNAAIAIVAVCTGHMRTTRFRLHELTPETDPLGFWGRVAVCAVLAAGAFSAALRKR